MIRMPRHERALAAMRAEQRKPEPGEPTATVHTSEGALTIRRAAVDAMIEYEEARFESHRMANLFEAECLASDESYERARNCLDEHGYGCTLAECGRRVVKPGDVVGLPVPRSQRKP